MTIYDLQVLAHEQQGEYVLGAEDLGTHACYLIFGYLGPGEKGRLLKPGKGHEEIVCLVRGEVSLRNGSRIYALRQGQAFHFIGESSYVMDNHGDENAVYVIAGGHSAGHTGHAH